MGIEKIKKPYITSGILFVRIQHGNLLRTIKTSGERYKKSYCFRAAYKTENIQRRRTEREKKIMS